MVLLHFKKSDANQFLYETTTAITIDKLVEELVTDNNMRLHVDRAAQAMEELAAKGPLKPEALRGLDEAGYEEYLKAEDLTVTNGLKDMPPQVGVREVKDESHYRTGWLVSEEMTQKMLDHATEMKRVISAKACLEKRNMSLPPM